MIYILGFLAVVVLVVLALARSGAEAQGTTLGDAIKEERKMTSSNREELPLVAFKGVKIPREWWPREQKIGSEEFVVRTKDVQRVINSDVYLERWWHRESMGAYYLVEMEHGKTLDYQDSNLDKFRMRNKYKRHEEEGRLFVAWSPRYTDEGRDNVYNMTLNVFVQDQPFPMHRPKGHKWYLHPNSFNAMLKKTSDPEELATMMEEKMAANAAKG